MVPFFMEGVWGNPSLLIGDGLHPNSAGVRKIVEKIAPLCRKGPRALGRGRSNHERNRALGSWRSEEDMPRLFTALEIPPTMSPRASRGCAAACRARAGSTLENYHITLRFIGDVDDRLRA